MRWELGPLPSCLPSEQDTCRWASRVQSWQQLLRNFMGKLVAIRWKYRGDSGRSEGTQRVPSLRFRGAESAGMPLGEWGQDSYELLPEEKPALRTPQHLRSQDGVRLQGRSPGATQCRIHAAVATAEGSGVPRRPAPLPRRSHLTRSRYAPVRVSTRIRSPTDTNNGTCTVAPVSNVAGFDPPLTVSPRMPGVVAVTVSSTALGSSTPIGRPSWKTTVTSIVSFR